jgi:hypothetical protein
LSHDGIITGGDGSDEEFGIEVEFFLDMHWLVISDYCHDCQTVTVSEKVLSTVTRIYVVSVTVTVKYGGSDMKVGHDFQVGLTQTNLEIGWR